MSDKTELAKGFTVSDYRPAVKDQNRAEIADAIHRRFRERYLTHRFDRVGPGRTRKAAAQRDFGFSSIQSIRSSHSVVGTSTNTCVAESCIRQRHSEAVKCTRDDVKKRAVSTSTVLVAGSRQISRLPTEVRARLDTMIERGFQILVGDANGVDKAVQRYLADKSYPNVLVHCMKDHCRNNIGNWPTRQVVAPRGAKGFDYYSVKDRAMAEGAEYGLMLWDGKSKGTVRNVVNLCRDHTPVVVYVAPTRQFRTIKSIDDLKDLLAQGDSDSVGRIVSELRGQKPCFAFGSGIESCRTSTGNARRPRTLHNQ